MRYLSTTTTELLCLVFIFIAKVSLPSAKKHLGKKH